MNERWQIIVELTYDPEEDETSYQAIDRAKQRLNAILDGKPFQHYHILQLPKKV